MYNVHLPRIIRTRKQNKANQRHSLLVAWLVQFRIFLSPKFPDISCLLSLHNPVCVGPGRAPKLLVCSCGGSHNIIFSQTCRSLEKKKCEQNVIYSFVYLFIYLFISVEMQHFTMNLTLVEALEVLPSMTYNAMELNLT